MGYILPVKPNALTDYVNRDVNNEYNFAKIQEAQKVELQSRFGRELEKQAERLYLQNEQQKRYQQQRKQILAFPPLRHKVQINRPVPPSIATVSGKGGIVNTYI